MTRFRMKCGPSRGTGQEGGGIRRASWIFSICIVLLLFSTAVLWGKEDSQGSYKKFVESIGKGIYFLAWPTAAYERASFGGVSFTTNGVDVSFRLHGKSGINGGPLWVDVIVEIRAGKISDLRWGDNNAILAPPGSTMKAMEEILAELNREYSQSQGGGSQQSVTSQGYRYYFLNSCNRAVTLAIHYKDVAETWRTVGWWTFAPGEGSYLLASGSYPLRSNSAVWYYYAETTDGSGLRWVGNFPVSFNGRNLRMQEMNDKEGDSEWSITCK
ncbi:MAG TPA: DUF1036 domain-containing protein [Thermoanaerobaculia bacterium]|nr:DUF1036 domain-containing protein [Thermoanaerobaculia bacterium]